MFAWWYHHEVYDGLSTHVMKSVVFSTEAETKQPDLGCQNYDREMQTYASMFDSEIHINGGAAI